MAFIESGKSYDKQKNNEVLEERMGNMDSNSYLLRIPATLHQKVKLKLVKDNRKLRSLLLEALEQYIKE